LGGGGIPLPWVQLSVCDGKAWKAMQGLFWYVNLIKCYCYEVDRCEVLVLKSREVIIHERGMINYVSMGSLSADNGVFSLVGSGMSN
jgi:hypothetical protein